MSVEAKILCLLAFLVIAFLAVAAYNNHRATTGPRYDCEQSGGVYSTDLQRCLQVPR